MLAATLLLAMMQIDPANLLQSVNAQQDWEPNADPQSGEWAGVPGVTASRDFFGLPVSIKPMEVRSRWTAKNLYLLFICPYRELHVNKNPVLTQETDKLWNQDVAEAFIGSDYLNTSRYKEFQVSPLGEYVDLDIDRDDPKSQKGIEWQSGFTVKGNIDARNKVWYGEMRIPFGSLDVKTPKAGTQLRIGLYRISGKEPRRIYIAWRPTNATTFHVPSAFGSLVLQ